MVGSLRGRALLGALATAVIAVGAGGVGRLPVAATNGCINVQGPVGAPFVDCSAGQALNIVPPGENGLYNAADLLRAQGGMGTPPHTQDQLGMYGDLVKVAPNLGAAQLQSYYKDASFHATVLPGDTLQTIANHPGTAIIRDAQFGVPHIFGQTRYDTEFGAGYASAQDRLFMMDVLRHYGRGQLSSFVGASPADLAMDCSIDRVAGYTEAELQQQVDKLPVEYPTQISVGGQMISEGQLVVNDGNAFADGVNAYIQAALADPTKMPVEYAALQVVPAQWSVRDIVATATLVQAIFAIGGGNEVDSALLYQSLVQRYGATQGAAMWSDFRSQNDPEARSSLTTPFPYEQVPASVDPSSVAMPTAPPTSNACNGGPVPPIPPGSGQTVVGPVTVDLTGFMPGASLPHASNQLIVNANHSATGHPIAVFGPQTGYYAPEILHEIELHGPGISSRGVAFPGTEVFVELGRGADYAWSATSAGADIIDQRVERLCNVDGTPATQASTAYVYNGACTPMYERSDTQVAKPTASSTNPPTIVTIQIERTVHGPVVGRTTAIDPATGQPVPVAVSTQRSTWFDELGAAPAFMEWNNPDLIHGVTDFQRAAGKEIGTFNWTYVDSKDVGYYMAGKLPIRNPRVNPNFPVWGTGQWEWQGFVPGDLSAADLHPRAVNPPAGFFTNWNNKPAPGFSAADNQFGYGPVYRVQSLSDRVSAIIGSRLATPTDIVNAMEDAGTVDLDGSQLVTPMAAALGGATLTARQAQALAILEAWVNDPAWAGSVPGAHRRDRSGSSSYEQGNAVAIMDALYPRLAHAIFDPWLNGGQFSTLQGLNPLNNPPGPTGSAYDGGWEGYLQRALRQAANPAIANGYSQSYCGGGSLATCQTALVAALQGALDSLSTAYGNPDPATWTCSRSNGAGQCNPGADDIQFNAVGVGKVPGMPWVNRPTFQQVVSYPAGRAGGGCSDTEGGGDDGDDGGGGDRAVSASAGLADDGGGCEDD
ncbi:MAG TPA: penicillin acylase family protein [Candidatus Dormibacteraeota bacterium]|nr:penicillin acylase family protein [Candidatus Dormibacteraeota bacterium]